MTCASECKCEDHVCQISRAHALQVALNANREAQTCASECNCGVYVPTRYCGGAAPVPRRCRVDRSRSGVVSVWVK